MKRKAVFYLFTFLTLFTGLSLFLPYLSAQTPQPFDCETQVNQIETEASVVYILVGDTVIESGTDPIETEIFLSMGEGDLICADPLPAVLLIQNTTDAPLTITVNGAPITFDSLIGLQINPQPHVMFLLALEGGAEVEGAAVEEGFLIQALLEDDGRSLATPWLGNRPFAASENELLASIEEILAELPTPEAIQATAPATRANCTVRNDWPVYTVRPGDTLSGIATRSGSTVQQLAEANCLANVNAIRAGQQLRVPRIPSTPTASFTATFRPTATFTTTSVPLPTQTPSFTATDFPATPEAATNTP